MHAGVKKTALLYLQTVLFVVFFCLFYMIGYNFFYQVTDSDQLTKDLC